MTDDDFARGDKEEGKEEKRRRKKFVIGEKLIRIIFDQSTIYPIFLFPPEKFLFFRFSSFSLAETTPLRALAEVRLRFSF
jgi:hypothetical protein